MEHRVEIEKGTTDLNFELEFKEENIAKYVHLIHLIFEILNIRKKFIILS